MPFGAAIGAVLKGYDWRLDQAAATLGAGRLTVLRLITLPLLRGGIISAALFASCTLPRPSKPPRAPEDEGLLAGEAEAAALGPKLV